jgi:hypothetical protein
VKTGVLSLRFSASSCWSTTFSGGGGLRPSKLDRGFKLMDASPNATVVATVIRIT